MSTVTPAPRPGYGDEGGPVLSVDERSAQLLESLRQASYRRTDRIFAWLMICQWAFAIVLALTLSPYAWEGKVRSVNVHVPTAILLGGLVTSLPVFLAFTRPGWVGTRYVIACAQMLWSAILIHLSGGRIETHFHVFGSLAFVAFYRDYRVLVPATVVVAGDHFLRGLFWPESVYGVTNPEWWRFLEHAGWVVFEDVILVLWCVQSAREMAALARKQAELEAVSDAEAAKAIALHNVLEELRTSQATNVRTEKLAAIGKLAAGVSHELRNPLAAVRNANTYLAKRVANGGDLSADPRVKEFLLLIDRELVACGRIIAELLDFARERKPTMRPCPVRELVDEAMSVVSPSTSVRVVNEVPAELPIPVLDRDMLRQVLVNLVQNAIEAIPAERQGAVTVRAHGGPNGTFSIVIEDDGGGMPAEVKSSMFEPLFTTKTKGTGLGLAIVQNLVRAQRGSIHVESEVGSGTRISVELPVAPELVTAEAS